MLLPLAVSICLSPRCKALKTWKAILEAFSAPGCSWSSLKIAALMQAFVICEMWGWVSERHFAPTAWWSLMHQKSALIRESPYYTDAYTHLPIRYTHLFFCVRYKLSLFVVYTASFLSIYEHQVSLRRHSRRCIHSQNEHRSDVSLCKALLVKQLERQRRRKVSFVDRNWNCLAFARAAVDIRIEGGDNCFL